MKNKAQMQSQIFVYIMVLIVGAAIFLLGYNSIQKFMGLTSNIEYDKLVTTIKSDFQSLTTPGSSMKVTYKLPSGATEICFAEPGAVRDTGQDFTVFIKYPLIKAMLNASTDRNVFFPPKANNSFYVGREIDLNDKAIVPTKFKCFSGDSGTVDLLLTSEGKKILVENFTAS